MLDANASEELVGVWYLRQEREMRAIQRGREGGRREEDSEQE